MMKTIRKKVLFAAIMLIFMNLHSIDLFSQARFLEVESDNYRWYKLMEGVDTKDGVRIVCYGAQSMDDNIIIPISRGYTWVSYMVDNGPGWYLIKKDNKVGACYKNGQEAVAPRYDRVYNNHRCWKVGIGEEIVGKGTKWGVCDMDGREIVEPKYDEVYYDSWSDRIKVKINGKTGVYDLDGRCVLEPKYGNVYINYGLIEVGLNGKEGVYDLDGRCVLEPKYDMVFLSRSHITVKTNGTRGAYDLNGQELVAPLYESLRCNNGVFETKDSGKWVSIGISIGKSEENDFINSNTNASQRHREYCLRTEEDGFRWYQISQNGKQGALSWDSTIIIPISREYNKVRYDYDGCFIVEKDGLMGACDMNGREIFLNNYQEINAKWTTTGSCAFLVKRDSKWGVCGINGQEIITPQYYDGIGFHETKSGSFVFVVKRDKKYGFCDEYGQEISKPKYDNVYLKVNGGNYYFEVDSHKREGACDEYGREIIKPKYKALICNINGIFEYQNASGKWIPVDIDVNGKERVDTFEAYKQYCAEGDKYFDKGKYRKAAKSYKKALEFRQTPETYYNVGVSYKNAQNYNDAITYFQYCINSHPNASLGKKAQDRINESRQYMAQKEARKAAQREEIAEALIGGTIGFVAGVASASLGVNTPTTNGNMDYLLDPNYAIWQAQQQQAEFDAINQQLINLSIWQTEQQEYETYLLMTSGGTSMTFEEWKGLMAQAAMYESNNMEVFPLSDDGSSEYKGKLSPDQYEAAYRRYENCAQSCFRALTAGGVRSQDNNGNIQGKTIGQMPGGSYVSFKQGLSDAQREMKRIRQEASQYGVIIQQSQWETATAGY